MRVYSMERIFDSAVKVTMHIFNNKNQWKKNSPKGAGRESGEISMAATVQPLY